MIQLAPEFKLELACQEGREILARRSPSGQCLHSDQGQEPSPQRQQPSRDQALRPPEAKLEMGWVIIRLSVPQAMAAGPERLADLPATLLSRLQRSPTIGSYREQGPLSADQLGRLKCLQIGTGQWCSAGYATWFPTPEAAAFYVNRLPGNPGLNHSHPVNHAAVFLRRRWLTSPGTTPNGNVAQETRQPPAMLDRFQIR